MAWQVLITDNALSDLRQIVEFIAPNDPNAAERTGQRLLSRAMDLATMPERHPHHDKVRGIRKFPVVPYLVFYHCDETSRTVHILHFWHGARRSPEFQ